MMNRKPDTQQLLFEALTEAYHKPFFMRLCRNDDAIWVCDLGRKIADSTKADAIFHAYGIQKRTDPQNGLWLLDFSVRRWEKLSAELPSELPRFPENERYHRAYALARLLMKNCGTIEKQPSEMNRHMYKLFKQGKEAVLKDVRLLHEQSAQRMRRHEPAAGVAGQMLCELLAGWQEDDKQ